MARRDARRTPWLRTACPGVVLATAATVASPAVAPSRAATPEQIDAAIAKGKQLLYSRQNADHNWEYTQARELNAAKDHGSSESGGQWGGKTALVAYALIAAGEDVHSPRLAAAIDWLKKAKLVGVYALGTRCQVWLLMPETDETRKLIRADAETLDKGFNTSGKAKYLYGYLTTKRDPNLIDHSASQFGVLGMWAAEQLRPESVPDAYWSEVDGRWLHDQQPDGGWFYAASPSGSLHGGTQASMTAAGVATLFITQDYVGAQQATKCSGNVTNPSMTAIDKGLAYMAGHLQDWAPDVTFGTPQHEWYSCYTLYGVERIGVASGLKYIGTTDWYQYGADWCVKHQAKDGSWRTPTDTDNTALALLFLARGRAPILVNKVQYDDADGPNAGKSGHWDERPRDIANLVRWAGRQTERDLNWQVTNLKVPEADLHDAPFLYLSGNQALRLTMDEKDKLRQFCNSGGMTLFNADCGAAVAGSAGNQSPFVASVVSLARDLFPNYEFRDLPPSSPVYSEQFPPSRWKRPPTIRALSNGVRELMVLLPDDPAKAWQLRQTLGTGKEEAFQSLQDIFLYGTDKQPLRAKGIPFLVTLDSQVKATGTVKVGRVKYAGNWDPEPGGWQRLAIVLHNRAKVDLDVQTVELGKGQLRPDLKALHLTGTTTLRLSGAQLLDLKGYIDRGGTLIVDAAGGSAAFAQSVETLLTGIYPQGLGNPLPPADPLFKRFDPNLSVRYRPYARMVLGHLTAPELKAIKVRGRPGVYYSREDLSGGLVGEDIDGIIGYDPPTATAIMAGILLGLAK
jgi:hypothetical protein